MPLVCDFFNSINTKRFAFVLKATGNFGQILGNAFEKYMMKE
jgi:hypothetical protein